MSDLKDNYIDRNMADEGAEGGQDNELREEDVDEEMFIFPDRASEAAGEEEKVQNVSDVQEALKSTQELIMGSLDKNESKQSSKGLLIEQGSSKDASRESIV